MREEYLLAALRMGVGADPVPENVSAAARAAFDLRVPGGVPARPVDLPVPPGTRSSPAAETAQPGVRRFSADGLVIDIETTVAGGRLEVAGQVSPAPGPDARVEVRTPHIAKVRVPSGTGHFAVAGLPPGWVSVVCHRPDHPPVFTRWIHVRG
ncbi:hypothetical protein GCM10010116_07130 [Microbispora rosea subsp. aerata]|nr:hypothetical protein [Microbispora rosea]GGO03604.1 hypothetical protein GCM10010116_07130 [Microbispora rosea subsp. aerata]GIH54846.1 hypothetical protein Mro02_17600 [Microbispora rosea subsp. aerata]GLJ83680.1 hypothetical protein GCM10017588_24080 [Microbispora rosea subsp. aerata]